MRNRKELKDSTCINNVKMSADMELCFISVFCCKKTNRGYTKDTWVCYINLNGGKLRRKGKVRNMAYRILLVEDDHRIREIIEDYFSAKSEDNMEIVTAQDGNEGLALLREEFDLVFLDVMLPGIDGFSLCREIRRSSIVPVIFITARAREEDVLYGYELGCDDYIVKPFSPAELYAKANAVLKRSKGMVIEKELVCGEIRMNLITLRVTAAGKQTELAPKEFAMLKYLMEHKNWVVSRDTLLDKVWGADYFGSDRVVDNHIKKLRKALGDAGGQVKTVVTKGYKLTD